MYIHNFYNDLLLSIRILFDNHIFSEIEDYIKRYEFNIGNRTFQLDSNYKPNFEFPIAIVSLNDDSLAFGGGRTEIIKKLPLENINQIEVLNNHTNNFKLILQEEHSIIPITITINCESQLNAKEIEVQIKRFLPVSKYIEILEFVSFLEVDSKFLNKIQFNPVTDIISNLFIKLKN